jgi:hypothetical protein
MKKIIHLLIPLLLLLTNQGKATVQIDGTAAQRTKIANWLTQSLGATVGVDAAGNLTIGAGGNAAATRLRNMINDATTSVTLKIVVNDPRVLRGGWQSSDPTDIKGITTGTQKIDIDDIEKIGNVLNGYGETPDRVLIHEITEVYEGKKGNLKYEPAHTKGVDAEKELMTAHGTSWVFRIGEQVDGDYIFGKIKRPDGSFVIIRIKYFNNAAGNHKTEWFREAVPCTFEPSKLIAIADPDPKVHIFNYTYDLNHTYSNAIDTSNSRPTGVAFDAAQNLYVTENHLTGQDEIRIFNPQGKLINTIKIPELINPEGIDVDKVSGEIFVAVQKEILRLNNEGKLLGSYNISNTKFQPTDVSVWRNYPTEELFGDGKIYDIFVTDKVTSQVYRFSVQNNMNAGTFVKAFGGEFLNAPEGIQVDDWWTVWVASTGNNRVYCFTPEGNTESFTSNPYFIEDASLKISDLAKVRDDGVYILDGTTGKGKLLLYDFTGKLIKTYGTEILQCPASLAATFSANVENLISIPDPGSEEKGKSKGLSPIILIALAVAFLLAAYFVYRLVSSRRNLNKNN